MDKYNDTSYRPIDGNSYKLNDKEYLERMHPEVNFGSNLTIRNLDVAPTRLSSKFTEQVQKASDQIYSLYASSPNGESLKGVYRYGVDATIATALSLPYEQVAKNHDLYTMAFTGGKKLEDKALIEAFGDAFKSQNVQQDISRLQNRFDKEKDEKVKLQYLEEIEELEEELVKLGDYSDRSWLNKQAVNVAPIINQSLRSTAWAIGGAAVFTALTALTGGLGTAAAATGFLTKGLMLTKAAKLGMTAGNIADVVLNVYSQERGSLSRELYQMVDEDGNRMSDEIRNNVANVGGILLSVIEVATPSPGFDKALSLIDFDRIAKTATRQFCKNFIVKTVKGGISESTEELLQSLVGDVAKSAAQAYSNRTGATDYEGRDFETAITDYLTNSITAFGQAFVPSMLAGMPFGAATEAIYANLSIKERDNGILYTVDKDKAKAARGNQQISKNSKIVPRRAVKFSADPLSPEFEEKMANWDSSKKYPGINVSYSEDLQAYEPATKEDDMLAKWLVREKKAPAFIINEVRDGKTTGLGEGDFDSNAKSHSASVMEDSYTFPSQQEADDFLDDIRESIISKNVSEDGSSTTIEYNEAGERKTATIFVDETMADNETIHKGEEGREADFAADRKKFSAFLKQQLRDNAEGGNRIQRKSVAYKTLKTGVEALVLLEKATGSSADDIIKNKLKIRVLLDEDDVNRIAGKDGIARGWMNEGDDGVFTITLTKDANESTIVHETGHVMRRLLSNEELKAFSDEYGYDIGSTWLSDIKTNQDGTFTLGDETSKSYNKLKKIAVANEERFVDDFLAYCAEGVAPTEGLQSIFHKMKEFISGLLSQNKKNLNPKLREAFDNLFTADHSQKEYQDNQKEARGEKLYQKMDEQEMDAAYMDAVNGGDMDTARRIIEARATEALENGEEFTLVDDDDIVSYKIHRGRDPYGSYKGKGHLSLEKMAKHNQKFREAVEWNEKHPDDLKKVPTRFVFKTVNLDSTGNPRATYTGIENAYPWLTWLDAQPMPYVQSTLNGGYYIPGTTGSSGSEIGLKSPSAYGFDSKYDKWLSYRPDMHTSETPYPGQMRIAQKTAVEDYNANWSKGKPLALVDEGEWNGKKRWMYHNKLIAIMEIPGEINFQKEAEAYAEELARKTEEWYAAHPEVPQPTKKLKRRAQLPHTTPFGYYEYMNNGETWVLAGNFKLHRLLTEAEVRELNQSAKKPVMNEGKTQMNWAGGYNPEDFGFKKNGDLKIAAPKVKVADVVTRDTDGSIIPPSERFDTSKDDVLFQKEEEDEILRTAQENGTYLKAPNGADTKLNPLQWVRVRTKAFLNWFGDWMNDPENASRVVDENGEPKVMYHGSLRKFTVFNPRKGYNIDAIWHASNINTAMHWTNVSDVTRTRPSEADVRALSTMPALLKIAREYIDETARIEFTAGIYRFSTDTTSGPLRIEVNDEYVSATTKEEAIEALKEEIIWTLDRIAERSDRGGSLFADFISVKNPLIVDAQGSPYHNITYKGEKYNTESLAVEAKRLGHDGVIVKNVMETDYENSKTDDVITFVPNQIKSATDNNGDYSTVNDDILFQKENISIQEEADLRIPTRWISKAGVDMDAKINTPTIHSLKGILDDASLTAKIAVKLKPLVPDRLYSEDNVTFLHNVVDWMTDNVKFMFDQVPEKVKENARLWYDMAHVLAEEISGNHNLTIEQSSAIIAALSPQKDWFMNVSLAERYIDILEHFGDMKPTEAIINSVKDYKAYKLMDEDEKAQFANTRLADMDDARAALFLMGFNQNYNSREYREIDPMEGIGLVIMSGPTEEIPYDHPAPIADQSGLAVANVVSVYRDGSLTNISAAMGKNAKVRSFYNNIVAPWSDRGEVTADTHAIAAAFMSPDGSSTPDVKIAFQGPPSNVNGYTGWSAMVQDAYRNVAQEVGLLPREVQSIVWVYAQKLFDDQKSKENYNKVKAMWNGEGDFNDIRRSIRDAFAEVNFTDFEKDGEETHTLYNRQFSEGTLWDGAVGQARYRLPLERILAVASRSDSSRSSWVETAYSDDTLFQKEENKQHISTYVTNLVDRVLKTDHFSDEEIPMYKTVKKALKDMLSPQDVKRAYYSETKEDFLSYMKENLHKNNKQVSEDKLDNLYEKRYKQIYETFWNFMQKAKAFEAEEIKQREANRVRFEENAKKKIGFYQNLIEKGFYIPGKLLSKYSTIFPEDTEVFQSEMEDRELMLGISDKEKAMAAEARDEETFIQMVQKEFGELWDADMDRVYRKYYKYSKTETLSQMKQRFITQFDSLSKLLTLKQVIGKRFVPMEGKHGTIYTRLYIPKSDAYKALRYLNENSTKAEVDAVLKSIKKDTAKWLKAYYHAMLGIENMDADNSYDLLKDKDPALLTKLAYLDMSENSFEDLDSIKKIDNMAEFKKDIKELFNGEDGIRKAKLEDSYSDEAVRKLVPKLLKVMELEKIRENIKLAIDKATSRVKKMTNVNLATHDAELLESARYIHGLITGGKQHGKYSLDFDAEREALRSGEPLNVTFTFFPEDYEGNPIPGAEWSTDIGKYQFDRKKMPELLKKYMEPSTYEAIMRDDFKWDDLTLEEIEYIKQAMTAARYEAKQKLQYKQASKKNYRAGLENQLVSQIYSSDLVESIVADPETAAKVASYTGKNLDEVTDDDIRKFIRDYPQDFFDAKESGKFKSMFKMLSLTYAKMQRVALYLDGGTEGAFTDTFVRKPWEAYQKYIVETNRRTEKAKAAFDEIMGKVGTAQRRATIKLLKAEREYEASTDTGKPVTLTGYNQIAAYIYAWNVHGLVKLISKAGNRLSLSSVAEINPEGVRRIVELELADRASIEDSKKNDYNRLISQAKTVMSRIPEQELHEVLKKIEDMDATPQIDPLFVEIGETMLSLLSEEQGRNVKAAYDDYNVLLVLQEKYMPLAQEKASVMEKMDRMTKAKRVDAGHLQERNANADYPLLLDPFAIFYSAIHKQEMQINMDSVIRDLHSILDPTSKGGGNLQEIISEQYGKEFGNYFREYVNHLAGFAPDVQDIDKFMNRIMNNVVVSKLINLMVPIKQLVSLIPAMTSGEINAANLISVFPKLFYGWKDYTELMKRYAPEILLQSNVENETNRGKQMADMSVSHELQNVLLEKGMAPTEFTDRLVKRWVWMAAFDKYTGKGMSDADAAFKAGQLVQTTQSTSAPISQAPLQRRKDYLSRTVLRFTNDVFQMWNQITWGVATDLKGKHFVKAFSKFVGAAGTAAVLAFLTGVHLPDDGEEDKEWDEMIKEALRTIFTEYIPVIGLFDDILTGERSQVLSNVVPDIRQLVKMGYKEHKNEKRRPLYDKEDWAEQFLDLVLDSMEFTGFPVIQSKRVVDSVWDGDRFRFNGWYWLGNRWGEGHEE